MLKLLPATQILLDTQDYFLQRGHRLTILLQFQEISLRGKVEKTVFKALLPYSFRGHQQNRLEHRGIATGLQA